MGALQISKLCNALYADAALTPRGAAFAAGPVVDRLRKRMGGLWVGGRLNIDNAAIRFEANSLNRMLQDNIAPVSIGLACVRSVELEGGWVTKIVAVHHDGGVFRFRCYGARAVAGALRCAMRNGAVTPDA